MLVVNNHTNLASAGNLFVAGTAIGTGVFAGRSSNGGTTWTAVTNFGTGQGVDIVVSTDGTAYVFYLVSQLGAGGAYTNWLQYYWLHAGATNWSGPEKVKAHSDSTNYYSTNVYASGNLKRSSAASEDDYFISNGFARVAVNPVNGRFYVVYADLPAAGSTTDRGDIFMQEAVATASGSLTNWSGAIKVNGPNTDGTSTDQWNPSIAVDPTGTRVFVGFYSRQGDPSNNAQNKAYGSKAIVSGGLIGATFDVFPVSNVAFTNLFCGTTNSTPSTSPWMFDPVWSQTNVVLDASAMVVETNGVFTTGDTYVHFTADDYTWSGADSSYFYFAWRDCSDRCTNTWKGTSYIRADPNIRLGRIKP